MPFTGYFQSVFARRPAPTVPSDWSGRILRARVRVASGFNPDPAFPTDAEIYVQTG